MSSHVEFVIFVISVYCIIVHSIVTYVYAHCNATIIGFVIKTHIDVVALCKDFITAT